MGKYVIVVESGSDVTPRLCERYGIVRVPMHVTIGDETVGRTAPSIRSRFTRAATSLA